MSRSGNPKFLILCVALSFAIVLEAAPRHYPERSLVPHHHDRYQRQSYPYNAGKHFQRIDQQNEEEDPYERPRYNYQRYPRNDQTTGYDILSMNPNKGIGSTIYDDFYSPSARYLVPSAAEGREYEIVDDDLNFSSNLRDFGHFPISLMREESSEASQRHVLTDRELGKILRKALESANYGDVERESSIKRFTSPAREPAGRSDLVYSPRTRTNYPRHMDMNEPRAKFPAKLAPEPVDETPEIDDDGLLIDAWDEFEKFRSVADVVATIAEPSESTEDQPVTVIETEPITHPVNGNEGTGDDDAEGDVISAIIEYEDGENVNEKEVSADDEKHDVQEDDGYKIFPVEMEPSPSIIEDSKITDIEEEFRLADETHEPLSPTEELYTNESID